MTYNKTYTIPRNFVELPI